MLQEINGRTGEPELYPGRNTLYFGSYFKGTKVAAVDEFDVLVILDSNNGVFRQNGISVGKGLGRADPNYLFDEIYKLSDGSGVSLTKLLNWLENVSNEQIWGRSACTERPGDHGNDQVKGLET